MIGFFTLAVQPFWQTAPLACGLLGFGYYMVHNTLQTNATQMLPERAAPAVAGFSSALFLGQSAGVALAAPIVDRAGSVPVFVLVALLWLALGGVDLKQAGTARNTKASARDRGSISARTMRSTRLGRLSSATT